MVPIPATTPATVHAPHTTRYVPNSASDVAFAPAPTAINKANGLKAIHARPDAIRLTVIPISLLPSIVRLPGPVTREPNHVPRHQTEHDRKCARQAFAHGRRVVCRSPPVPASRLHYALDAGDKSGHCNHYERTHNRRLHGRVIGANRVERSRGRRAVVAQWLSCSDTGQRRSTPSQGCTQLHTFPRRTEFVDCSPLSSPKGLGNRRGRVQRVRVSGRFRSNHGYGCRRSTNFDQPTLAAVWIESNYSANRGSIGESDRKMRHLQGPVCTDAALERTPRLSRRWRRRQRQQRLQVGQPSQHSERLRGEQQNMQPRPDSQKLRPQPSGRRLAP